ncbi:MAG: 30S ribosomal protein S16 [Patescibacteria group bacterium]|mgnify:FL=1
MLKIRLAQYGSKNRRTFRIVAIDESKRRNGKPVEILGFYNPLVKPAQFKIDQERLTYWKSQGAVITIGVSKLLTTKTS